MSENNLKRMKTLDDAWNAQDWDVFRKRHSADTTVYWPGQREPTRGREAHHAESAAFFRSIENHLENNPYRVMFASGDWTCTIARWRGKMIGPWKDLQGKVHPPTNKSFDLEFCTVAHWKNGEIVEEMVNAVPASTDFGLPEVCAGEDFRPSRAPRRALRSTSPRA